MTPVRRQHLTIAPCPELALSALDRALGDWFVAEFKMPTAAQRYAWPCIRRGDNLLLSAPTGSGKSLAAFLPIISDIIAACGFALAGNPASAKLQAVAVLYVAPLKALVRDVFINLKRTWRAIQQAGNYTAYDLRIGLRTGDTSQRVRRRHLSDPPPILLTTPESLAQMLAQPSARDLFRSLRCVILDEVHALCESKRGADLAVCLERLELLAASPVQRIGLSATCAPLSAVADFVVGVDRPCSIAQVPDRTEKRFTIEPLFEDRGYSPGWLRTLLDRIEPELTTMQTTLIFTNTRSLAERVTWALKRRYPDRQAEIAVHHSAISPARRRSVERRLKHGRLWTVISSTSLELGIDIGTVDNVIFIHPPGGVVRLLQRVGRSGHRPDEPRRGLVLTATPDELLEAAVTARSGCDAQIEPVRLIETPLDVLCQQLVGMAMTDAWQPDEAFTLIRRAAPFRNLGESDFNDCLDYLSGRRRDGSSWLPARLAWQDDRFVIADERTARLLRRNLGTILTEDACAIRLRTPTEEDDTRTQTLGEIDQSYAERLQPGDRFVLDGRCLEIKRHAGDGLVVDEVFGRPLIPRWLGAGVPMSTELARRIFLFRASAAECLRDGPESLRTWLTDEYQLGDAAIEAIVRHLSAQEKISEVPVLTSLLIENVALQSCTEFYLHTPLPRSANEAIARILVHRLAPMMATAHAADLGIYVLMQGGGALSPNDWRMLLGPGNSAEEFGEQLRDSELMRQQFARIAQTGLMVLRNPAGRKRKVGGSDWVERRLFEQLRERDAEFVLLRQAEREVVTSACDVELACAYVEQLAALPMRVRRLAEPSPFGESLLGGALASGGTLGEVREYSGRSRSRLAS